MPAFWAGLAGEDLLGARKAAVKLCSTESHGHSCAGAGLQGPGACFSRDHNWEVGLISPVLLFLCVQKYWNIPIQGIAEIPLLPLSNSGFLVRVS